MVEHSQQLRELVRRAMQCKVEEGEAGAVQEMLLEQVVSRQAAMAVMAGLMEAEEEPVVEVQPARRQVMAETGDRAS